MSLAVGEQTSRSPVGLACPRLQDEDVRPLPTGGGLHQRVPMHLARRALQAQEQVPRGPEEEDPLVHLSPWGRPGAVNLKSSP